MTGATRSAAPGSPWVRGVIAVLLIGHGLIHAMGPAEIWGVANLPELTGTPSVDLGETAATVVAVAWLVALGVLVAAGWGILARRSWWRPAAIVGVIISQLVIVVWWADAATGTIPNLLILTALLVTRSPPAQTITGPDVAAQQGGQASSPTATG
jgi:hypothetical protein